MPTSRFKLEVMIRTANEYAAEIDKAQTRPDFLLEQYNSLVASIQEQAPKRWPNFVMADVVVCPSNW